SELTTESLMSENWLLTYEAITQGWVSTPKIKTVKDNEYFGILHKHKVQFYDTTKNVIPFKLVSPITSKPNPKPTTPARTTEVEYEATQPEKKLGRIIATSTGY